MINRVNFVNTIQKQTPKQMERIEEINGLVATLLSNTQVTEYYDYRDMLDSLEAINKVTAKYPETRKLVENLAKLTYNSYVSHRQKLEKEYTHLSDTLTISYEYKKAYDHYKSSIAYDEEAIIS